jgi:hypothetical protein
MALALKKKAVYFVRERKHLPFMLQKVESVAPVKVCEFKTADRVLTVRTGALFLFFRLPWPLFRGNGHFLDRGGERQAISGRTSWEDRWPGGGGSYELTEVHRSVPWEKV